VTHVIEAEAAYAAKLGIRRRDLPPEEAGPGSAVRAALLGVLGAASTGEPLIEKGWPPRYAARRIAWHVLDHAWEIEDRSTQRSERSAEASSSDSTLIIDLKSSKRCRMSA